MAERIWHIARGAERRGTMTQEQLRGAIARGEVVESDLVWTEGMGDWKAVKDTSELGGLNIAPPFGAVAAGPVAAAQIGYFSGGMPPRALVTLSKHEKPRGDVGDWPLDDLRVEQFSRTMKYRKLVTGAAGLYRALLLFGAIASVIFIFGWLVMVANAPRGAPQGVLLKVGIPGLMFIAVSVLYFLCWKATMRSRRWAPLTMLIVFLLGVFVNIASCGIVSQAGGRAAPAMAGNLLGAVLLGLFAYISWRAYSNIPKYLMQPAWCQEIIVKAEL